MFNSFFKKKNNNKNNNKKEVGEKFKEKLKEKFNWKKIISFKSNEINQDFFDQLEEQLLLGDLGGEQVNHILQQLQEGINNQKIKEIVPARETLKTILRKKIITQPFNLSNELLPVIFLMGVNGVGKTTTIAKLSHHLKKSFPQQVWGAADTFRAAATVQLQRWSEKMQTDLVNKGTGADAASVVFDTIHSALAKKAKQASSLAIIDTAGRLHNQENLMNELTKIIKVSEKFKEKIIKKNLLVLDATLGTNGFEQAKIFHKKIGLDGIIITKMDALAKGGVIFSITETFNLPIYFITFGEGINDLEIFKKEDYINSII